jgi:uncharacterized protein YbjQ (UPF0145 family)
MSASGDISPAGLSPAGIGPAGIDPAGIGPVGDLFTSDLTIDGFALCDQLELTPLAMVMGSSIYQVGYQSAWEQFGGAGGLGYGGTFMVELNTLSQALNDVRESALGRLAEEARRVGAHAVVEVDTRTGESQLETGITALEHIVVGTAVRRGAGVRGAGVQGPGGSSHPVLTELSVADFSKLVRAGYEPLGVVAWSSVFFSGYAFGPGIAGGELAQGFGQNYEQQEFTRAFYEAREQVMTRLSAQASALGATGVVGVRIGHNAARHTLGGGGAGSRERSGLMITFNAVGTAIRQHEDAPLYPPEKTLDLNG